MDFGKALEALKAGKKVRLPHWKGYWQKDGENIKIHCKDGRVLDLRETEDIFYTLSNITSDEWELAEECDIDLNIKTFGFGIDLNIKTFGFGEAIRNLKAGKKVARKGWNGKGMFLYFSPGYAINVDDVWNRSLCECLAKTSQYGIVHINSHIDMKAADGTLVIGWLASQADMLAEDWEIVE